MGSSKGSSTTTVQMTPEQQELLKTQTNALKNVFIPAYANTITGAGQAYQATNPAAETAAQTAMNVAGQTGQLQQQTGTGALTGGTAGQENMAAYQQGLGQGLTGTGAGGLQQTSAYQQGLGQGLTGAGAGGVGNVAGYQQGLGQGLTGYGAGQLSQLFSPQYKEQQINAALQPATEDVREQMNAQGAMYGGAGGLGSARQALASQNLASLSQNRLAATAAGVSSNVEAQRQAAANALLGAGQTATGQAGSLYSSLLGAGQGATNAAQSGYGQLLGAGQTAAGQAGSLYGNLAGQGQSQLAAANQAAASRIGYAGTPQDVYNKYAQVIFGVPQGNTTANFQGTQGQTTSGKSSGFSL